MHETQTVLPPDVYDTYELAAEAFGGIGGGAFYEERCSGMAPRCQAGFRMFLSGEMGHDTDLAEMRALDLRSYGIGVEQNDYAVREINLRKGTKNWFERVSWAEYCEQLQLVRGEA